MGSMEGIEAKTSMHFAIYITYHVKRQTPILLHENVTGFVTNRMAEICAAHGYKHNSLKTHPMDIGVHIGRPRRHLTRILRS